jgi:hypothetical protein
VHETVGAWGSAAVKTAATPHNNTHAHNRVMRQLPLPRGLGCKPLELHIMYSNTIQCIRVQVHFSTGGDAMIEPAWELGPANRRGLSVFSPQKRRFADIACWPTCQGAKYNCYL